MSTSSVSARVAWTLVLALLLGLRLLGVTGYMPALERGAVTIVACPDADASAPLSLGEAHHHHGKTKHGHHGSCPFASASGLGVLRTDWGPLLGIVMLAAVLLAGRPFASLELHRPHERPPLRGPPIPG